MTDAIADAAELEALLAADRELTAPGAPFELADDVVAGEPMLVYERRPSSIRAVLEGAPRHGDRDAYLFDDGRSIGYQDVVERVGAVAARLRDEFDIGAGDRVGIAGANGPEWILSFWAVTSLGAAVVALNAWWTGPELERAVEVTDPELVLADERRRERLAGLRGVTMHPLEDIGIPEPADALPEATVDEDAPGLFLFTSGTTGRPKAAVLSNRAVVAYLLQQAYLGARSSMLAKRDRTDDGAERERPSGPPPPRLAVFPLFHVSGLSFMTSTLLFGSPTLWTLGRFDAGRAIALTNEHGITMWNGSITHIHRLLDHPDIATVDPAQMQAVGVGGSATTPDIIRKTRERFPHLVQSMASGYGATEAGLIAFAPSWMLLADPTCAGTPLPGVEVQIRDDAGREVPDGTEGDVCVRSQATMTGYWDNDEANQADVLPGRWVRIGDIGRLDRGVLHLSARKRDLIIRGGENVYPSEIEDRLAEHDAVAEVAVFGVEHPELGQEVTAVVVAEPGHDLDVDELREHCADALAAFKVPTTIEVRNEPLPRTPTGKVMKHVLDGSAESAFIEE